MTQIRSAIFKKSKCPRICCDIRYAICALKISSETLELTIIVNKQLSYMNKSLSRLFFNKYVTDAGNLPLNTKFSIFPISIVPQLSKCLKFDAVWGGVLTDQMI